MASFEQGDIVRIPFPYTDRSTRQRRPALVVSRGGLGEDNRLLWVAMITSAENRLWADDVPFGETYIEAGLPAPSLIRPCTADRALQVGDDSLQQVLVVEEHAFSSALDYVRELYGGAPTSFESANAVTQLEAVRAGVGLGVVHDFIARRFKDLKRVLPERRATRAYWLVTHEDTRGLGRIRAVAEHLAKAVTRDRGMFL